MEESKLIGFIGIKKSGKDTCSDYLVERFKYYKLAFGDPVKKICAILFNLSNEQLEDRNHKEKIDPRWNIAPRTMFQRIGTEFGQEMLFNLFPELNGKIDQKHLWVELLKQKMCSNTINKHFVISDIRFNHEANFIKENNGILIKINRKCLELNDSHKSENELDFIDKTLIDYEIDNNYTLEDLYSQIDSIIYLSSIKKKN